MADPVSWLVVERGWSVVSPAGGKLGTVDEVIGDADADIFNGLSVASGVLGRTHYVAAEHVRRILEGSVELDLDKSAFDALDEHASPPG